MLIVDSWRIINSELIHNNYRVSWTLNKFILILKFFLKIHLKKICRDFWERLDTHLRSHVTFFFFFFPILMFLSNSKSICLIWFIEKFIWGKFLILSHSLSLLSFHLYHTNIELYQGCQENFLDSVQRETIAAAEGDWDRDRVWGIGRMS